MVISADRPGARLRFHSWTGLAHQELSPVADRAIPKSMMMAWSPTSMMLAGLRSRCTMPASCAATSPGHHIPDDRQRGGHRQLAVPLQHGREIRAFEVRHRDVLDAVDLAEIVNADDVLVGHLAGEDQFLLEPALHFPRRFRVARCLGANDFEGDPLPELGVPHLVHRTHTANAENLDDVIAGAERLPDGQRTCAAG